MTQIMEIGDVFGLLLPVTFVVLGVVAVFMYGLKRTESPKFRASSVNNNSKRKKRNAETNVATTTTTIEKPIKQRATKSSEAGSPNKSSGFTVVEKKLNSKQSAVPVANGKIPKLSKLPAKGLPSVKLNGNDNEVEGEWQTVTKKQKKQTTDTLIQAVAEIAAKTAKTNDAKKKERVNNKKNKTMNQEIGEPDTTSQIIDITTNPYGELTEAEWTAPKTVKKNKKRALKE